MPFKNKIRLPVYFSKPQYPDETQVFDLADGTTKILSSITRYVFQAESDYMSDRMHRRLKIALTHDSVFVESDNYVGLMRMAPNSYKINWPDFLGYPLGKSEFEAQVTPFQVANDNCQTCEEAIQLGLVDDTLPDPLAEGVPDTINVFTNDSIYCSPITAIITWFNTDYLTNATIDQVTGIVTLTPKAEYATASNVKLVTYRVTCPNEAFDEADVYGDTTGSLVVCQPPSNLVYLHQEESELTTEQEEISFDASPSAPAGGYEWELYSCDNLGTPILTGTTASSPVIILPPLDMATCYTIAIRAVCDVGDYSEWVSLEFNTPGGGASCGLFLLTNNNYPAFPTGTISYYDCNGLERVSVVKLNRQLCMLMDEGQQPVYFVTDDESDDISYEYIEPC